MQPTSAVQFQPLPANSFDSVRQYRFDCQWYSLSNFKCIGMYEWRRIRAASAMKMHRSNALLSLTIWISGYVESKSIYNLFLCRIVENAWGSSRLDEYYD